METVGELSFATGESDLIEILGTAFFDDDSNDDSSSKAVRARGDDKGSSSSENIKVPVGGTIVLKLKGSLGDGPSEVHYTYCRRLTEIFSVRFLAFKKLNLDGVYGVILVTGSYPYVIFERLFGDPQRIDSEGYIRLAGPRRAIETADGLSLMSCLFNSRVKETPRCYNGTMWTLMHTSFDQFSMLFIGMVQRPFWKLLSSTGKEKESVRPLKFKFLGLSVRGTIRVQIVGLRVCCFTRRVRRRYVLVRDVIPLPLSRKATVLPLGSTLIVDLCIWHHCSKLSTEDVLVEATVPFDSSLAGEEEKIVCGNRGKIKVKATWKTTFTRQEIGGHW